MGSRGSSTSNFLDDFREVKKQIWELSINIVKILDGVEFTATPATQITETVDYIATYVAKTDETVDSTNFFELLAGSSTGSSCFKYCYPLLPKSHRGEVNHHEQTR